MHRVLQLKPTLTAVVDQWQLFWYNAEHFAQEIQSWWVTHSGAFEP
jgi:hypothetical protein